MLKFIVFSIAFFFLVRYINRLFLPSNKKRQQNFNPFTGRSQNSRKSFDEIEEAEYEDLSNKDN